MDIETKVQLQYPSNNGPLHQKNYICVECNKSYALEGSLTRHLKYECGKQPQYQCPYCRKRIKLLGNVWQHIRLVHSGNEIFCTNVITKTVLRPKKFKKN